MTYQRKAKSAFVVLKASGAFSLENNIEFIRNPGLLIMSGSGF